jgi:hypothetical protein
MNIEERLRESEKQFEQKKTERDQHLQVAEDCLLEMTKLQGEYRVLQELSLDQPADPKKVNKKANVIEAVPEVEGK